MIIESASETDLDAIDEIERHSFKSNNRTFRGELLREWARIDVAREGMRILAFCNYWLVTPRAAPQRHQGDTPRDAPRRDQDDKRADGELHILAIATHPDFRGRGIATQLLAHVLEVARTTGCSLATLEVRRSNAPAIALYERAGFSTVHVRARYYQDDEDALVMLRGITEPSR